MEERIKFLEIKCAALEEQAQRNAEYINLLLDACNEFIEIIEKQRENEE